jgi:hypothetical protein
MVKLRSRIKRVIKFSQDDKEEKQLIISSAIKQLRPIEFYYQGGYRTVEPFALGAVLTDRRDNLSLLCWQTRGFSDNDEIEGWKLYRVSDMEDLEVISNHFTGDRPGYKVENLEMVRLIAFVKPPEHPVENVKMPVTPPPEIKVPEPPPVAAYVPPAPSPVVQVRPIPRVLSHNELMERFREAHPQPIPQMENMVWEEPLESPYPEPDRKPALEKTEPKVWPDTPIVRMGS